MIAEGLRIEGLTVDDLVKAGFENKFFVTLIGLIIGLRGCGHLGWIQERTLPGPANKPARTVSVRMSDEAALALIRPVMENYIAWELAQQEAERAREEARFADVPAEALYGLAARRSRDQDRTIGYAAMAERLGL